MKINENGAQKSLNKTMGVKIRNSVVCALIFSVIAFVFSFAVICPNDVCVKLKPVGKSVNIVSASNASVLTEGTVDSNGNVTVIEGKPCILHFPANGDKVSCFELNLSEPIKGGYSFTVESSIDGSFIDNEIQNINFFDGDISSCVRLERGNYTGIRIWFETDCKIDNISFYEKEPIENTVNIPIQIWRYVLVVLIVLVVFAFTFIIDYRYALSNKICSFLKKKYMRITTLIIGCGIGVILGFVTELIIRMVFGYDSIGNGFNTSSCALYCTVYVCIFIFFHERKNISKSPENAIFFIILVSGVLIVLSQPFGYNGFDVESHYSMALNNSYFGIANYTDADKAVRNNNLFTTMHSLSESEELKSTFNSMERLVTSQSFVNFSIAHVPSGIFIAVARLFGADFYTRYIIGAFPNIFIYATAVYFAMKKLKSGKMILATVALLPTNIFITSNYSYDYWVNAFSFLGVAYFISEIEQPNKPIKISETVIMCAAFALAALPKQIYVMLLVLPFFMCKNWQNKKAKKTYYYILITSFVTVLLLFIIRAHSSLTGSGDIRGGDVNPTEQVAYIFSKPLEYSATLIKFLSSYLSTGALGLAGYTTFFAYLGNGKCHLVFLALICFTVLTDKNEGNRFKYSWLVQIVSALLLLGGSAVIASALYIAFTPVGLKQINGCQPRYIVPILLPFLLTITNPGIRIFKNKGIYNFVVLLLLSVVLIYDIAIVVNVPMM